MAGFVKAKIVQMGSDERVYIGRFARILGWSPGDKLMCYKNKDGSVYCQKTRDEFHWNARFYKGGYIRFTKGLVNFRKGDRLSVALDAEHMGIRIFNMSNPSAVSFRVSEEELCDKIKEMTGVRKGEMYELFVDFNQDGVPLIGIKKVSED